ncbi:uncharacterized protein N7479_007026 [Penicillium vulpinum]|uniref:uncharacterized protein n=1 Tax=Penicillium vulpinum TaxID=29845 RepID=UPI0025472979|nr:uncharacterized protein N7479_007026 [Penicillium vulpinum]KAJ5959876.1 hypothetical protein N7479_007026 [Penicillium vulpinum]
MSPITGSNILVIGGSSGIGAAVAKPAASEGDVQVSIASSNLARVEKTVQRIQTDVPNAQIKDYTVDVSGGDAESRLEKLFAEVTAGTGRPLDHLVYTAVNLELIFLQDVTIDFLRGDGQFLVFVPLLIAKVAPPFMTKSYRSSITFSTGRIAEKPMKGAAVMAGWAAALFGVTRTLALDLAPFGSMLSVPE